MATLTKGGNAPVEADTVSVTVRWRVDDAVGDVDVSAFLLGPSGKVSGDPDMVFYGQPASGDGSVRAGSLAAPSAGGRESVFSVDLASVPAAVERIAFCGTLHDAAARGVSFARVAGLGAEVGSPGRSPVSYPVDTAGATETAMVLCELYRRQGGWKLRAVGQGFAGGLKPLAESYGMDVSDAPAAPPPRPVVDLRKRTVDLTKRDARLGAHASKALDVMERVGLAGEKAETWLVLDISASMDDNYNARKVDALLARVLAAAFNLDDDGEINVVLFGKRAHFFGTVNVSNYTAFGNDRARRFALEPATMYGEAIDMVRQRVRAAGGRTPVYVMFVTDGGTQDVRRSKDSITDASREPIFWQFMAIGEKPRPGGPRLPSIGKRLPRGFEFLEMLDTMEGRMVDNANFFAVDDPTGPTDDELYGMMFGEFPDWLRKARALGIVSPRPAA